MKPRSILWASCLALFLPVLANSAAAQCCCFEGGPPPPPPPNPAGGTWTGPGDSLPTPGTGTSPTVGGAGPTSPGSPAGGNPARPSSPGRTVSGPGATSPGGPATSSDSSSGASAVDPTSWQYWWRYNRAPFWDLKHAIATVGPLTGGDDFFLGRGMRDWRASATPLSERAQNEIAPALRGVLAEGTAPDAMLVGALLSLAKFGGTEDSADDVETTTVELFERYLDEPNAHLAETAVLALGILGIDQAAFSLAHLAADDEVGRKLCTSSHVPERMRAFAAYGLGVIGARTERVDVRRFVVQKLTALYDRESKASTDLQVACLLAAGLAALELETRPSGERDVPVARVELASRALETQVAWALAVALDDSRAAVVRGHGPTTAARLVASRGDGDRLHDTVQAALVDLLAPHAKVPREVRQSAALALGELADSDSDVLDVKSRRTLSSLAEREQDQQARAFALLALGRVGGRAGTGSEPLEGAAAIRADLERELARGKTFVRPWAALALGLQIRALDDAGHSGSRAPASAEALAALRSELEEARAPELQGALCTALGIARDALAAPVLQAVVESAAPEAREYAAVALGMIGDRGSIPQLEEVLRSSRNQLGLFSSAAIALAMLQDVEVVPELVQTLEEEPSLAIVGTTTYALGFIGDVRAVDGLLAHAFDESHPVAGRGFALQALGNVADKDGLPWNTCLSVGTNYSASVSTLTSPDLSGVLDG